MAPLTHVGTVNLANLAVSGTRAVTGLGFTPKAIIFWGQMGGSLGDSTVALSGPRPAWGVATADSEWSVSTLVGTSSDDNQVFRYSTDQACLAIIDFVSGAPLVRAVSLSSLDADGFTLVCTAAMGSETNTFGYLAIGGADIEVKTGTFTEPVSTGAQGITGVGFKPGLVFVGGAGDADEAVNSVYSTASFGFASINAQAICAYGIRRTVGSSANREASYCRLGELLGAYTSNANNNLALTSRGELTSMGSDGFNLNWSAVAGDGLATYRYLAISGVSGEIGTMQLNAAALGQTSVSGLARQPQAVMLLSHGFDNENDAGVPYVGGTGSPAPPSILPARWCQGAFTAANQFSSSSAVWSNSSEAGVQSNIAFSCVHVSTDGTLVGSAYKRHAFVSIESDGFTLGAQEADNFTRMAVYLSLREAPIEFLPPGSRLAVGATIDNDELEALRAAKPPGWVQSELNRQGGKLVKQITHWGPQLWKVEQA